MKALKGRNYFPEVTRSLTRPWELSLANGDKQSAELAKTYFAEVTDLCQPA